MPTIHLSRPSARAPLGAARRQRGQSLVEFALVVLPLMLLLVGIVQMGLVFNAYVTLSSATREGARAASIYVYDRGLTKAQNDTARATAARTALLNSLGLLQKTPPQYVSAEQTVAYSLPAGDSETDARVGQNVTVHGTYHLEIIVPIIGQLLPLQEGRMSLDAEVTMVVN